ncbi:MAG TPA: pseudouridine synthase [Anaerolineaceae bacterium]|nr:pseudouridine synthase [Anaerolineaceae bacterium]
MPEERVQKIMANAGLGSRRACEELITAGRVTVNGQVAILGMKADPEKDRIVVDGRPLKPAEKKVYVALNKPRFVLSDLQEDDPRKTVRDLIPIPGHLYPVGRLDFESEGLILMTNDGDLANHLTHPRYEHEKEYHVLVASRPDEAQLATWKRGVVLEDGTKTAPAQVFIQSTAGKGAWLRVILKEGKKRQIREVGKTIGLPVVRILRVRIGDLHLGTLKPGEWRYLSSQEIAALKEGTGRARLTRKPGRPETNTTDRPWHSKPKPATSGERKAPGRPPARKPARPTQGAKPGKTTRSPRKS